MVVCRLVKGTAGTWNQEACILTAMVLRTSNSSVHATVRNRRGRCPAGRHGVSASDRLRRRYCRAGCLPRERRENVRHGERPPGPVPTWRVNDIVSLSERRGMRVRRERSGRRRFSTTIRLDRRGAGRATGGYCSRAGACRLWGGPVPAFGAAFYLRWMRAECGGWGCGAGGRGRGVFFVRRQGRWFLRSAAVSATELRPSIRPTDRTVSPLADQIACFATSGEHRDNPLSFPSRRCLGRP